MGWKKTSRQIRIRDTIPRTTSGIGLIKRKIPEIKEKKIKRRYHILSEVMNP
jgi:hypothetical protein